MKHFVMSLSFAVLLTGSAYSQTCPSLPSDSLTTSSSIDDIPATTNAHIQTYLNTNVLGKANHVLSYVQIDSNTQQVWFGVDSSPGNPTCYYNRRARSDSSHPWQWEWSASQPLFSYGSDGSVTINAVLFNNSSPYSPDGSNFYKYVMYGVYQPAACNGDQAGFLMASFSNNGTCWTTPTAAQRSGGPSPTCAYTLGYNLIPVESASAVDDSGTIRFLGLEGNISILADISNMYATRAVYGYASASSAATLTIPTTHDVSVNGIVSPLGIYLYNAWGYERYRTYSYFINMSMAYSASTGDLYVIRAYPYPLDKGAFYAPPPDYDLPSASQVAETTYYNSYVSAFSSVQGCAESPATYPNRIQLYKMHIGSLSTMSTVTSGTWTVVSDLGGASGYESDLYGSTALVSGQTNAGVDYGAGTFFRDGAGNLVVSGGTAYMLGSHTLRESKSSGPCYTTGNEREFAISFAP